MSMRAGRAKRRRARREKTRRAVQRLRPLLDQWFYEMSANVGVILRFDAGLLRDLAAVAERGEVEP